MVLRIKRKDAHESALEIVVLLGGHEEGLQSLVVKSLVLEPDCVCPNSNMTALV